MTRRKCLGLLGLPITLNHVTTEARAGVHVSGTLTASETEASEGYYNLCNAAGVCHATDALMIAAHPKSPLHDDLRAMVGRNVQVSIFTTP